MKLMINSIVILSFWLSVLLSINLQTQAQPCYAGEWHKTRLYGHAYASHDFSDEQYEWIRDNFEYFCIEKTHLRGIYGNPSHEKTSRITAAKLVNMNPRCKPVMIYSIHHAYADLFESEAQLLKDHPEYFYDNFELLNLAIPAENAWYVDVVNGNCDTSNLHGIFIDGVNGAVREGFWNSIISIMDSMTCFRLMNGFHLQADRTSFYDGPDMLEHADAVLIDSWFRRLCDSKNAAVTLIETCLQVPEDKVVICNSANDIDGLWGNDHSFSHAAYLIVMKENTYYRWAGDGTWGADVLMNWHEDFGKVMGKPLSAAVKTGYAYERVFEHCTVNINVESKTSSVDWDQNNTLVNVTGISLSSSRDTISVGEHLQLTASFSPSNATYQGVSWNTSNSSIATSSGGLITAKGAGSCTITVTTSEGGYTANYSVTITDPTGSNTLHQPYDGSKMSIYPSPAGTRLYYEMPQIKSTKRLEIYSCTGRLMQTDVIDNCAGSIIINQLNSGLYFIKTDDVWPAIERFIKE